MSAVESYLRGLGLADRALKGTVKSYMDECRACDVCGDTFRRKAMLETHRRKTCVPPPPTPTSAPAGIVDLNGFLFPAAQPGSSLLPELEKEPVFSGFQWPPLMPGFESNWVEQMHLLGPFPHDLNALLPNTANHLQRSSTALPYTAVDALLDPSSEQIWFDTRLTLTSSYPQDSATTVYLPDVSRVDPHEPSSAF